MSRYAAGPTPRSARASLARRTWSERASSSEYTATVGMPSSAAARAMRTAISPRFATRSLPSAIRLLFRRDYLRAGLGAVVRGTGGQLQADDRHEQQQQERGARGGERLAEQRDAERGGAERTDADPDRVG